MIDMTPDERRALGQTDFARYGVDWARPDTNRMQPERDHAIRLGTEIGERHARYMKANGLLYPDHGCQLATDSAEASLPIEVHGHFWDAYREAQT